MNRVFFAKCENSVFAVSVTELCQTLTPRNQSRLHRINQDTKESSKTPRNQSSHHRINQDTAESDYSYVSTSGCFERKISFKNKLYIIAQCSGSSFFQWIKKGGYRQLYLLSAVSTTLRGVRDLAIFWSQSRRDIEALFKYALVWQSGFQMGYLLFSADKKLGYKHRRISTKWKAKVDGAVWGTEFIKFVAALAIFHWNELKNMMNCTRTIWRQGWIHAIVKKWS